MSARARRCRIELPALGALGAVVGNTAAPSSEGLRLVAVDADGNTAAR